jgi:3-methyl-2-oxobutanoate hydroxymethyltransferase
MKDRIIALKGTKKIIMLTAYDFQMARIISSCAVDLILVGDTLGVVFQGRETTKQVTMEAMLYHTEAVVRGAGNVPVIGDMPIHTYDTAPIALENAKRFLATGAQGVKIEGYAPGIVSSLVEAGIPVMGHLGVLPQTALSYKVVGKNAPDAEKIKTDAQKLAREGVFSIVLECVPEALAKEITQSIPVPTIGIGAGLHCDGQVLVINDLLGMDDKVSPKYVKRYADLKTTVSDAVQRFTDEVRNGVYPDSQHTYH